MVVHNLLSNPNFDNGFDYAPFQEHDKDGNHQYENFILGNWCWRQAVCIIYIMWSFFWSLTYLQDEIRKKPSSHGVTLVPIILGSDKTTVSVATGQNEYWPIYISISNIHNNIRWVHHNGVTLLGFLANPKSKSSIHLFFINQLVATSLQRTCEQCTFLKILSPTCPYIASKNFCTSQDCYGSPWGYLIPWWAFIGTILVLVLKNEHFVKIFITILSQVIGTIKYSKITPFCCCSY